MKRKFQVRFLEGSPPAMGAGYSAQGRTYFPKARFWAIWVLFSDVLPSSQSAFKLAYSSNVFPAHPFDRRKQGSNTGGR